MGINKRGRWREGGSTRRYLRRVSLSWNLIRITSLHYLVEERNKWTKKILNVPYRNKLPSLLHAIPSIFYFYCVKSNRKEKKIVYIWCILTDPVYSFVNINFPLKFYEPVSFIPGVQWWCDGLVAVLLMVVLWYVFMIHVILCTSAAFHQVQHHFSLEIGGECIHQLGIWDEKRWMDHIHWKISEKTYVHSQGRGMYTILCWQFTHIYKWNFFFSLGWNVTWYSKKR